MVLPAVVVLLCFAIFPLIISAYLALSRFALAPGGFTLKFIGLVNFRKLLVGSQQYHLLGKFGTFGFVQSAVLALIAAGLLFLLARYLWRGRPTIAGMVGRLLAAAMAMGLAALALATMAPGGVPGTVVNTLLY
ncbi:MAG: sugar ABC transporter permease, partial [Mesorhizobium sp.]